MNSRKASRAHVGQASQLRRIRSRFGSGLTLFAITYSAYFIFGSINFFPLRGEVGPQVLLLAAVGLVSFVLGNLFLTVVHAAPQALEAVPPVEPIYWRSMARISALIGIAAFGTVVIQLGGIPLFLGEERTAVSGYVALLVYGLVAAVVVVAVAGIAQRRTRLLLLSIGGAVILLALGYRTLTVLAAGATFLSALLLGRVRLRLIYIAIAGVAIYGLSWLAIFRLGDGADAYLHAYRQLGMPSSFEPFAPLWATPREGTSVLFLLMERVPSWYPHTNGQLLWSALSTVLPGRQLGPRLLVAQYVNGREGVTITPSLLGQPYVDFGWLGVIFFMFALGFVAQGVFVWQRSSITWAPKAAYGYVLAVLFVDLHSGLLDVSVIGTAAVLIWWAAVEERAMSLSLSRSRSTNSPPSVQRVAPYRSQMPNHVERKMK